MTLPLEREKKYKIIYADPPWHYQNYANDSASRWVGNQYKTMSVDDICNLPIQDIADKDCVLFLWVTPPTLKDGLRVMEEWGFTYKTKGFCWVKLNKRQPTPFWGMGYWTRSNTEDCIIGVKGKPKRINAGIHQVVQSAIRQHSQKPDEVRNKIVDLVGDIPRIELFAREKTEGWDVWGNEVKSDISLANLIP